MGDPRTDRWDDPIMVLVTALLMGCLALLGVGIWFAFLLVAQRCLA